jgi:predicted transcriptional regulator YdeE
MSTPTVIEFEFPPTTVVGVSGVFISGMAPGTDAHTVIPQLWNQLQEIAGADFYKAKWSVGVMSDPEDDKKMNYVAAMRLSDNNGQHGGMDVVELPGGKYVACEHVGSLDSLGATTGWFYGEYLPSSELKLRDGYHLEIYDERFNPDSSDSVVLICAPVQSAPM